MLNVTAHSSIASMTEPTQAAQSQRQQQAEDAQQSAALIQSLQNPGYSREGFLEEAERLTILARMGVDIDTLNEIESEIDRLEGLDERSESEQSELESLLDQREQLFRDAMKRQNGEALPPGSLVSFSV